MIYVLVMFTKGLPGAIRHTIHSYFFKLFTHHSFLVFLINSLIKLLFLSLCSDSLISLLSIPSIFTLGVDIWNPLDIEDCTTLRILLIVLIIFIVMIMLYMVAAGQSKGFERGRF